MTDPIPLLNAALEGRYRIERELGEGGMATVYLADDLKHERKVALKVLKPELAAVVGAERFLAEIKTTANLQHPHILPLYDSGEADSLLFYVMPYVEGESLRERLDREHQLPIDDAVRIATNMAEALDYAHRQGVIHRDIKPANVLLQDGKPVISDFGIALAVSAGGGTRLTVTGLSLGTPHYMSPEQATGDQNVGPATDIFALGCVLYEMLVGEPPFAGSTPQAVLGRIISGDYRPAGTLRSSTPVHVDEVIGTAVTSVPADRFASPADFSHVLADPNYRRVGTRAGDSRADKQRSLQRWRAATIVATIAAATFAVVAGLRETSAPEGPVTRYYLDFPPGEARSAVGQSIALSPDGNLFAYVGPDTRLWLRERDSLNGSPIEGTESAAQPAFSPDGRRLAFVTNQEQLVTVSLDGAPPRVLVPGNVRRLSLAWSVDDHVYFTQEPSLGLHRVPADGSGPPEQLTRLDAERGDVQHGLPEALPSGGIVFGVSRARSPTVIAALDDTGPAGYGVLTDGQRPKYATSGHLLFLRADGRLYAARFDESRPGVVGPASPVLGGLTPAGFDLDLSSDGRLVHYSGGSTQVVWVDRDGTEVPVDSSWVGVEGVDISPDGRRVTYPSGGDIWVRPLPNGAPTQLTFDGSNTRPFWAPDSETVAFISTRAGNDELWERPADGSAPPRRLLDDDRRLVQGAWLPDGSGWVFRLGVGDERDLYWATIADPTPRPFRATSSADRAPSLSPDGRWVAYVSDESGQDEIYVLGFPVDDDGPTLVSSYGGTQPLWSHGGDEIFYNSSRNEMVSAEVDTDGAFFVGARTVLFSTSRYRDNPNGRSYDVSPDDQRFLMLRSGSAAEAGRVTVVENYLEELKRLVPE